MIKTGKPLTALPGIAEFKLRDGPMESRPKKFSFAAYMPNGVRRGSIVLSVLRLVTSPEGTV